MSYREIEITLGISGTSIRSIVHEDLRMQFWQETGILIDKPKTVRTPENIAAVAESVCGAPSTSIHRRSQQLNISEISKIGPVV